MSNFKKFFFFVLVFQTSLFCKATDFADIQVNAKERILVAPFGREYKWYKEGDLLLNQTTESLDSVQVSGLYTVEYISFDGKNEKKEIFILSEAQAIKKIFLIGDSTVANYKTTDYPMTGWGQVLQKYISSAFVIDNRSIGGRSSRSFWEEGRWTTVKAAMTSGDYLLIQFGHNDRDTKPERYTTPLDYKNYLQIYVNESRAIGVIPILITPMTLNAWRNGVLRNVFTESGAEYVQKMKEVAAELNVPLIDLNKKSWDYVSAAGVDYASRYIYNTYAAGEYPNYPDGLNDGTHFQEMGALQMAKFISDGIKELNTTATIKPLSDQLIPQSQVVVSTNIVSAGVITKNNTYPQGVTITLKALVNTGHTFLYWKNSLNEIVSTKNIYTFVMGSSEVSYKAFFDNDIVKDCAGIDGGTAKLDNCGICSGGTSTATACTGIIQGEQACTIDGVLLETTNLGFTDIGYANVTNAIGSQILFEINASSNTRGVFSIRHSNGGTLSRDANLIVNGTNVGVISFVPTGNFSTWAISSSNSIALKKGLNSIVLESITSLGLSNIDFISWANTLLSKSTCSITAVSNIEENSNVAVFPNPFTSTFHLTTKEVLDFKIFDSFGKVVEQGTCLGNCVLGQDLGLGFYELSIQNNTLLNNYKLTKN